MKKVYINEYGPRVSAAVYGFWRWTEEELNDLDKLTETVLFTRELGIDTYDLSHSQYSELLETQFGKLLSSGILVSNELILATKIGQREFSTEVGNGFVTDLSSASIVKNVEQSLHRLQREKIDILILEQVDFISSMEDIASTLLKLQRNGKISYVGVANFNVFQQRLLSTSLSQPIITNHLEFNLLKTDALHDGRLDFVREQHSRALAFSPLADGRILLGEDEQAIKVREALIKVGKKYEANVEQIAVAWLNKLGALPIIGSKEKRRIQNAATAHEFELSREDWYYLYNASKS